MLRFDTAGWREVAPGTFHNDDGDGLGLYGFDLPPDLPAPLEDQDRLRRAIAAHVAASGGGLVELDVIGLDGLAAVAQIVKMRIPDQPTGVVYLGSFTVPRADRSLVLKVQCMERGVTGMRDSVVMNRFMAEHGQGRPLEEVMRMWAQHPYDPTIQGGLPRNWSEEPGWDPHFPDHPLSRARRIMHAVAPTIEIHPDFKAAPPFRG
ncbi:hypothetical protein GCM10009678_41610 [Actinomadura kijaniata]|uniref:Uncharacterized protein n=1 Tax=Actinomadura namibiensis TaxID=182080 RepID=A0A7W3QL73_ACTNM|nr:hypothetical protein [Actinomadura namibiensis]MBA8950683.1 hypothetical protein [Actinomadura namibiensis]